MYYYAEVSGPGCADSPLPAWEEMCGFIKLSYNDFEGRDCGS